MDDIDDDLSGRQGVRTETLRILVFNWKDITHPEAGGSEVFTHEVAKRLVERGNEVSVFVSEVPNRPHKDVIDGVEIIREGTLLTVYRRARGFLENNGQKFDTVVEEVNTRPFFARPLKAGTRYVIIIHQLAREFWGAEFPFPIAAVGRYLLEPIWLSRLRDEQVLVPSPSTFSDLSELGFARVSEFRYGLSHQPLERPSSKSGPATFLFLGRLKRTKLPQDAIKAFLCIKRTLKDAKMLVAGDGPLLPTLRTRYSGGGVEFLGPRYGTEKLELLRRAHLLLVPGIREGWGMVVTEANSMATPVVAYDVPGLRDSVRHEKTGILVEPGNHEAMAKDAISLLEDPTRYNNLRVQALEYSREFTWDKTVQALQRVLGQA